MFYNNLISIPILIVASFAFEDWGVANLHQNLYRAVRDCMVNWTAPRIVEIDLFSPYLCLDSHLFSSVIAPHGVCVSHRLPRIGWHPYFCSCWLILPVWPGHWTSCLLQSPGWYFLMLLSHSSLSLLSLLVSLAVLRFFLTRRICCGCGVCYCEESSGQASQNGLAHGYHTSKDYECK